MDFNLIQIATHILEVWLLLLGFQPTGNWDAADNGCLRDYGPHRVFTVQARMPADAVMDSSVLMMDLQEFIEQQSQLLNIGFQAYEVLVYPSTSGGEIYASIVHTA